MSIEDIDYLYKNSIKESVVTLVDSSTRNKFLYPKSNSYTIDFEEPFRYVYGVDILEASIPVSMYQIDKTNNTLFVCYPENYNDIYDSSGHTRLHSKHSPYYDISGNFNNIDISGSSFEFYKIELEPGNYDLDQLISQINLLLNLIIGPKTILCTSVFAESDDNTLNRTNDIQMKITFISISGKDFYIIGHKSSILTTLGFGDYSHSNSEAKIPWLLPEDKRNYRNIDTKETLKLLLRTSNDISGGSISEVIDSYSTTNTDYILDNLDIKIEPDISGQDNYIIYLDDKKKGKDNPYNVLYSYKLSTDNDKRFNENNHVTRQLYTNSHINTSLIPNSLTSKKTVIQGEQYGNGTYLVGYNGLSSDNRPFNIFDGKIIDSDGSYSVLEFVSVDGVFNQQVQNLRLGIERKEINITTTNDDITELNPIINAFNITIDKRELIKNLSEEVKKKMNNTANKNSDTSGIYINPIVNVYDESSRDISGFVDQNSSINPTPIIKASNTEKFFISFNELNNKNHTITKDIYLPNSTKSNRYEFILGDASGNTILGDGDNKIFNYGNADTSGTNLVVVDWRLLLKEIRSPGIVNLAGGKNRFCVLRSNIIEKNLNSTVKYRKNSPGIALFKLNVEGYTEDRFDYTTVKYKAFHPIGKLSSIDFRFETIDGNLYDFKDTDHHFLLNVKFFVPYQKVSKRDYLLNSNYNPNLIKYRKNQMDKFNEDELENEVVNNFNKEFLEKEKQYEYSSDEDLEYINKSESSDSSDSSNSNSIDSDTSEETLNTNSNQYFNMNRTIYNSNYKDSIF